MWKKKKIKLIKAKDKELFLLMQEEAEMQDWGEEKRQLADYKIIVGELYHTVKN